MTSYEYKVTPAPKKLRRVKGMSGTPELLAAMIAEAVNAAAREGWEYVRAESLPVSEPGGWFRRGAEVVETVLIFRRPRETVGPRLASAARAEPEDVQEDLPPLGVADRGAHEAAPRRREPNLGAGRDPAVASPLRGGPRLGPAD